MPEHDPFQVDFTGEVLLGQYEVLRRLAAGGMGEVYVAKDKSLDREVIVKVPHPRLLQDVAVRRRFDSEIETLKRLEHRGVVQILAKGEHRNLPFLVLQYLRGGSLDDRLGTGPVPAHQVAAWLHSLARTLDYVHAQGIVHRDVKPANILFDEEDDVYLADFGVLRQLHAVDGGQTTQGAFLGSPLYAAPEQLESGAVGPAADQYALAACAYLAVAGEAPFPGDTFGEIVAQKLREVPRDLRELAVELPTNAAAAVMRALERDPEHRFPSCTAFASAFHDGVATDADPSALGATSVGTQAPQTSSRRWAVLAVLAVVVLAGLLIARPWSEAPTPPPRLEGPPPTDGRAPPPRPEGPPPTDGRAPPQHPPQHPPHPPRLRLVSAGDEATRKVRRYEVAVGARERMRATIESTMRVRAQGKSRAAPIRLRYTVESEIRVAEVLESGDVHYEFEIVSVELLEAPRSRAVKVGRAMREFDPKRLADASGLVVHGIADNQGRTRQVWIEGEGKERLQDARLRDLRHMVRGVFVPLPEEPIGVGASWSISGLIRRGGSEDDVAIQKRFELTGQEGHVLEIASTGRETDDPHLLTDEDLRLDAVGIQTQAGLEVEIESRESKATSTTRLTLFQLAPHEVSSTLTDLAVSKVHLPSGRTVRMELQLDSTLHLERVRAEDAPPK